MRSNASAALLVLMLQELYEKMADAVDDGKAAVFKQTYDVMANKFQNVHPYQV